MTNSSTNRAQDVTLITQGLKALAKEHNVPVHAAGKAEALIQKQRHGPIGSVILSFTPELTKFGNLAQDDGGGIRSFRLALEFLKLLPFHYQRCMNI